MADLYDSGGVRPGTDTFVRDQPRKNQKPGKPGKNPVADMSGQEVAIKYGMSWAVIQSDPGLRAWFDGFAQRYVAAKGQIDYNIFKLELEQQDWWKTHSATYIADLQQELENPEDYKQALTGQVTTLKAAAQMMGARVGEAELAALAKNARRFGWNEAQQRNALAAYVDANPDSGYQDFEGQAGVDQDSILKWASDNGVTLSDNMVSQYVRKIATGETNVDEIKSDIRRTYMAGAFPAWSDRINAGMDIADIARPYKSAMAQLLEIDENSISFNDPLMSAGLQSVGADGKPAVVPLYEYQNMIRKDSRWQQTDNAYATYANAAQNILRTFGFA